MLNFRNATPADAVAIAQLHASSWKENYRGLISEDYLENEVEGERIAVWQKRFETMPDNRQVLLAEVEGELVGFVCSFLKDDSKWGTLLDNLHIVKAWQGKGLGRQLMQKAAEWSFQKAPTSSLFLWVLEGNDKAIAFYKKIGGKEVEREKKDLPGLGKILAYRYVWTDLDDVSKYQRI